LVAAIASPIVLGQPPTEKNFSSNYNFPIRPDIKQSRKTKKAKHCSRSGQIPDLRLPS